MNGIIRPDRYVQVVLLFKFPEDTRSDQELTDTVAAGLNVGLLIDRKRVGGAVMVLDPISGKAQDDAMNGRLPGGGQ